MEPTRGCREGACAARRRGRKRASTTAVAARCAGWSWAAPPKGLQSLPRWRAALKPPARGPPSRLRRRPGSRWRRGAQAARPASAGSTTAQKCSGVPPIVQRADQSPSALEPAPSTHGRLKRPSGGPSAFPVRSGETAMTCTSEATTGGTQVHRARVGCPTACRTARPGGWRHVGPECASDRSMGASLRATRVTLWSGPAPSHKTVFHVFSLFLLAAQLPQRHAISSAVTRPTI